MRYTYKKADSEIDSTIHFYRQYYKNVIKYISCVKIKIQFNKSCDNTCGWVLNE